MADRLKFSERIGVTPRQALQLEKPDVNLMTRLWNVLDERIGQAGRSPNFVRAIWRDVLVRPLDKLAEPIEPRWLQFREAFMWGPWHELYDIVEYAGQEDVSIRADLQKALEQGGSGYRFVGDQLTPITTEHEIAEIEKALSKETPNEATRAHLDRALSRLAERPDPDYRNSMKESILAIESIVRAIVGQPEKTLGDALKFLGTRLGEDIHPALTRAFSNLYGFTSDAGGIRHAMKDIKDAETSGPNEAQWMLVTCSAFVNFLVAKCAKASTDLK